MSDRKNKIDKLLVRSGQGERKKSQATDRTETQGSLEFIMTNHMIK